ncbi:MAG: hypothetical protein VX407_08280 [Verrucomicrobiota bacterium]|nr:hypothetical protein [Verrucomicrobiota bacterium]
MNEKSQLMNALKEMTEKRLLTSEVESLFEPYKDAVLPLSLSFLSATKSFGSQKNETYNDGYSVICNAENWEVEICLLFTSEDNSLVESFEPGEDFEANVKFIDYDALYQRAIFGKLISESDLVEDEAPVPPSLPEGSSIPDKSIAENIENSLIQPEFDVIEPLSEDIEIHSDARVDLLRCLNSREKSIEPKAEENKQVRKEDIRSGQSHSSALPEPSQLEKSGCWCLLLGGLVLMGSTIALGDGMDSFGFLVIGLMLCLVGGLSLLISKSTKNKSGKS